MHINHSRLIAVKQGNNLTRPGLASLQDKMVPQLIIDQARENSMQSDTKHMQTSSANDSS